MKGLRIFLLVVAIAVFVGSGGYLIYDHLTTQKDQQGLDELARMVREGAEASEAGRETASETAAPEGGTVVRVAKKSSGGGAGAAIEPTAAPSANTGSGRVPVASDEAEQGTAPSASAQPQGQEAPQPDPTAPPGTIGEVVEDGAGQAVSHEPVTIGGNTFSGLYENSVPDALVARTFTDTNDAEGLAGAVEAYLRARTMTAGQSVELIRISIKGEGDVLSSVAVRLYGKMGNMASRDAVADQIEAVVREYIEGDRAWVMQNEIIDLEVEVETPPILPQYQELYEKNNDMIGWIKIEGTQVNYPVMQTFDENWEFYLRMNFDKEYAYNGLPFMDDRCDASEPTNNLLIYGHNMKSGSMFGELPLYEGRGFWEKHKVVQFDLLSEQRTYEVFGMFRSRQYKEEEQGFKYYEYIDLSEKRRFDEYVELVKKASFVNTGVTPEWGDQLLTLSTCSYHTDSGTFVVVARRVT